MLPKNPKAKLRNDVFNPRAIFIGASKSKVKHSPSRASMLLARGAIIFVLMMQHHRLRVFLTENLINDNRNTSKNSKVSQQDTNHV